MPGRLMTQAADCRLALLALVLIVMSGCSALQTPSGASEQPAGTPAGPPVSPAVPAPEPSEEPSPVATGPAARGYAMMADLPGESGVVLLGGATGPRPPAPIDLSDMWTFAPEAGWRVITPALPEQTGFAPLDGTMFAFDTQSGLAVFVDMNGLLLTYDPATNRWADKPSGAGPTALLGAAMAYDSGSDRMIVFGGLDPATFSENNETWVYDVDAGRWERMEPAQSPSPRNFAALAYDADSDRVILFGGAPSSGAHGDTWAYDYEGDTWTEMSPTAAPSGRTYSAIAYDPTGDRMILFGGSEDAEISSLGDTWAYDYGSDVWTQLDVVGPSDRGWHAMALDADTGMLVLFGGGRSRDQYTAETWVFDLVANSWSRP